MDLVDMTHKQCSWRNRRLYSKIKAYIKIIKIQTFGSFFLFCVGFFGRGGVTSILSQLLPSGHLYQISLFCCGLLVLQLAHSLGQLLQRCFEILHLLPQRLDLLRCTSGGDQGHITRSQNKLEVTIHCLLLTLYIPQRKHLNIAVGLCRNLKSFCLNSVKNTASDT